MNKRKVSIIILLALCFRLSAQDISRFLEQVSENNAEIIAFSRLLEARRFEARTGLAPRDPEVSFGYMPEQTSGSGIKKTWSVTQSFAFPTKYITMKRLSRDKIILAEEEYDLARLRILLDTKYLIIDYIYNKKKLELLAERKVLYDRLKTVWQKMLDTGETTVLEYNRILFGMTGLDLQISRTKTDLTILGEKLALSAGYKVEIPDFSEYPEVKISGLEEILNLKKAFHPEFLLPESEYMVSQNELKLSRSGSLPEFQAGYSSEIVPGETYTGPVAGMTIPLWSNSNRIRTAKSMAEHMSALRDSKIASLSADVRGEYENLMATGNSISEVRLITGQNKSRQYLDKALDSGEITLTDYFLYLEPVFETEDKLLELAREYNRTAALLNDQELLQLTFNK
jgi:outer membrane protein TolC